MSNNDGDVIDLTESFTLSDHCCLADQIIEIDTDESFSTIIIESTNDLQSAKKSKKSRESTPRELNVTKSDTRKSSRFGNCPICWEELGKNPLASTKCGHVYCLICLERNLCIEKKCPTCRKPLKGSSAYHPLYI
ncbi:unnamed protein product [Parnassius apollo]|uniref:(apollo) hypothetical protein n=1 Tax=Parnassius apollo TaxID=110799 RepID=A0A8S3WS10_PARAO|nr:unnamed protein product [Parnassius apollo]